MKQMKTTLRNAQMRRMNIYLSLLILLTLAGCDGAKPTPMTTIEGRVLDTETNMPLPSVIITTDPNTQQVTTRNDGSYIINADVNPGTLYRVNANLAGYLPNHAVITTKEGTNRTADLKLEPIKPLLGATPSTLDFGTTTNSLTLTVSNEGNGGSFNWTLTVPNESWLQVDKTSGTVSEGSESVVVSVDRTGLAPNTYRNTLVITADNNAGDERVDIILVVP